MEVGLACLGDLPVRFLKTMVFATLSHWEGNFTLTVTS